MTRPAGTFLKSLEQLQSDKYSDLSFQLHEKKEQSGGLTDAKYAVQHRHPSWEKFVQMTGGQLDNAGNEDEGQIDIDEGGSEAEEGDVGVVILLLLQIGRASRHLVINVLSKASNGKLCTWVHMEKADLYLKNSHCGGNQPNRTEPKQCHSADVGSFQLFWKIKILKRKKMIRERCFLTGDTSGSLPHA